MGKALVTWILLTVFGWIGWNYAAPHFIPRLATHHVPLMVCAGLTACLMTILIVTGKLK